MDIKSCQICGKENLTEIIDGATRLGPWAYMCEDCHKENGYGFGIGRGQLLKYDPTTKTYKVVKGNEIRGETKVVT